MSLRYLVLISPPHGQLDVHVDTTQTVQVKDEPCIFKIVSLYHSSSFIVESLYREDVVAFTVRTWAKRQQLGVLSVMKIIDSGTLGAH